MKNSLNRCDGRERVGDRITIYPRGKRSTYVADFWNEGQHRRKSLGTCNKRIARKRAAELDRQLATGDLENPKSTPKVLVADAVGAFLEFKIAERLRPKSITRYRGELDAFADYLQSVGLIELSEITVRSFDRFRSVRAKERQSKTLHHEAMVCKQFTAWCESRSLVSADPLAGYKVKKPPPKQMPVPTLRELELILPQCSQTNRQRLTVLAMTGMRIGELQGLQKRNVDLGRGMIIVERQVDGPTKTKDAREIPIHPRLEPVLKRLLRANNHDLLVTARPSLKYPAGGHHIDDKKLNLAMSVATAKVTDKHYTLHSCRRFFNTHCINAYIPERVVRNWMGHRDRSMTGIYYQLRDKESCEFMRQIDFGVIGS